MGRDASRAQAACLTARLHRALPTEGITDPMKVKIKVSVEFGVSDSALEDAMAEYDELTVAGLMREIIDKAIACDEITTKVEDGPNTLEEYDQISSGGSAAPARSV